jgi:hypothetical protein
MFSVSKKTPRGESSAVVTSIRSKPTEAVSRERLRHFDGEVSKAKSAVADLERRIERLESIIIDADAAHRALQLAIVNDGGVALASYSTGAASADSEIARLVMAAETSARAATAAKAALPHAQASLENARGQLVSLGEERNAELNRVIAMLADGEARAYQKAFDEMCRLHDQLVGYASVAQANLGDVQLIIDPVKVPRFALPSLGNADADPFLRHRTNDIVVSDAAKTWSSVRARLVADVDADLSDLISNKQA